MQKFKLNDNIVLRKIDDEIIILNIENSCYYGLSETGIDVVNYLEKNNVADLKAILDYICSIYKVDRNIAEKDFENLINELFNEKIIKSVS